MIESIKRHQDESREELLAEIVEFEREREQLKEVLGRIGGRMFSKKDLWINLLFLVLVLSLFILEITTHFLPSAVSLEIGILLVSVKIILMIHTQQKVNHFQFWILNSIEFRMNDMAKRVRRIEKHTFPAAKPKKSDPDK
ncbi:MAG: hypothetical protein B6D68_00775 [spirochete symbiont of Stewartia floridana]|nr:MAG: hypothetical protein B6D68_00775 [spirochete symbiont of Stewartia floridana]